MAVAAGGIASFALLYAPQPVLPQLAADFRLDPGGASLAVGVATGGLAVAVLPVAALSEIAGRRRVILASMVVSVVLGLLLPLAPTFAVLLAMRAGQGAAIAGFAGVAAAYLVEMLGRKGVVAAVGAMIAGNSVGGMLGRLAAGAAAEPVGWRGALLLVAVVALGCGVVTLVALPAPRGVRSGGARPREVVAGLRAAAGRPVLLVQYAFAALGMGSFVALYNAAGFRLTAPPIGLAPALASLVFLVYAIGTVSSGTAARLVARVGQARALIAALAVTVAGGALTLPDALPAVILGFAVLTGGFFAAHTVANGWTAAAAPEGARGQASGLYTLAYYLGSSVFGTAGGAVYGRFGWAWLIALTSSWLLLALLAALGFHLCTARRRTPSRAGEGDPRRDGLSG
ncbi:YNFM family putative membrane transporter [Thermocatellispora tengchongensis]|uniref:YNFM family putative membrane transporter n=1 Tax=Thermocatellispora tengchongensis TaxID=1073253 RepID=A0A840NRR6_9ACTN|nr:MFS transporter [Thermocatellispora tengchongensis]MBB5131334.1 YNFM family putative membrane transporter [Thermocatellispora tengchongensis]